MTRLWRALAIAIVGALMLAQAIAYADETITFEWDFGAEAYKDIEEFRLFKRLNDDPYDYNTPWAKIPAAGDAQQKGDTRTYQKALEIVLPPNTKGALRFVMRAADEFNESGDSNEVEYRFSTAEVPEVINFRIHVLISPPAAVQ